MTNFKAEKDAREQPMQLCPGFGSVLFIHLENITMCGFQESCANVLKFLNSCHSTLAGEINPLQHVMVTKRLSAGF